MPEFLMGNRAFAHAALEAGVNVVAGYPGTPSSEVIETIAEAHAHGNAEGVYVEWSTNEQIALGVIAGAAYTGARTLFTCKQVGLNVASDPLMSLNYVGVKGGTVIFVADDPGPISSQTEQDTRRYGMFAKIPVLDPATPEQGVEMMAAAFEVSERYGTPVILRPTTRICHASAFFDFAEHTQARPVPAEGFVRDPKWVIFPKRSYEAHAQVVERLAAIARDFSGDVFGAFNPMTQQGDTPEVGILAGGISAAYAQEALRLLAEEAEKTGVTLPAFRFMQVGTPYPFPDGAVLDFCEGLDRVLVLEELDNVLEDELLALAGANRLSLDIRGKRTGDTLIRGENSIEVCMDQIACFLEVATAGLTAPTAAFHVDVEPPSRPPLLCPGCPHRGSFYAVKQALAGAPAELCGDIGCYTLGNAQPLDAVDTCLCMGAGISIAQGFAAAEPDRKHVAFVGDSTFFASGLPGVVNAVYNGHDITVVVLDNATTAMTGSQPHPGTGQTLMGPKNTPISIEGVLRAVGFGCITRANPFHLGESIDAAKEALDFAGPSAVIYEAPCISLVKPEPAAEVDPDTCTGCKDCITSIGCPAIAFDNAEGIAVIDPSQCTGCGLCVDICKFGSIELPEPAEGKVVR